MFETLRPMPVRPKRTFLTLSASAIAHSVALVAIIGISLIASKQQEAEPSHITAFVLPPGAIAPPPRAGVPQPATQPSTPAPKPQPVDTTAPATTTSAEPPPSASSVQVAGTATGLPNGVMGGTDVTGSLTAPPAGPVKVGGAIAAPELIRKVPPVYPPAAKAAHLTGNVVLEARVSPTGEIESVTVVQSRGLLDDAAVKAVKQWKYKPLLLNGQPTPFIVDVTVTFNLAGM